MHRDVKPGNLLRAREGDVKLADFGIAKATEQSSITQVGSVLGTAAYLAPEQARGEEAGPRADLYALGVVTYQLISGRLPYEATSLTELALKQQREAPPMLDALVAAVTPELADAVALALALDPQDRYQTARRNGARAGRRRQRRDPDQAARGGGRDRVGSGDPRARRRSLRALDRRGGRRAAHRRRDPAPAAPCPRGAQRARRAARGSAPPARAPRRRGRRLTVGLLALLALAGVIAAAILLTAPAPTRIALRNVVYSDVRQTSAALKQLVSENTK